VKIKGKHTAPPRFALRYKNGAYFVARSGTGTQLVETKFVSDSNKATHWPSKYAAKQGRAAAGLMYDEYTVEEVK
jgi:hypothetical protein